MLCGIVYAGDGLRPGWRDGGTSQATGQGVATGLSQGLPLLWTTSEIAAGGLQNSRNHRVSGYNIPDIILSCRTLRRLWTLQQGEPSGGWLLGIEPSGKHAEGNGLSVWTYHGLGAGRPASGISGTR